MTQFRLSPFASSGSPKISFDRHKFSPTLPAPVGCYTIRITAMQLEWDAAKDRANLKKHGVDFATAARVFGDPDVVLIDDRTDENGERRWHALGLAGAAAAGRGSRL